jgi:hypothetical protein
VNRSETVIGADLGSSSKYSNGKLKNRKGNEALKAVVEKVSLRVALMQGLVGPKCVEKSVNSQLRQTRKGIRLKFLNSHDIVNRGCKVDHS